MARRIVLPRIAAATLSMTLLSSGPWNRAHSQELRLPLYAKGNEANRPGLFMKVSSTVNDGSAIYSSPATSIIVDTGSSELNLPLNFFNFPGGKPPASFGEPRIVITYEDSYLLGVLVKDAQITLGEGDQSITIKSAPINIITQKCSKGSPPVCSSSNEGAGIIGVNFQDAISYGSNVFRWASAPFNKGFSIQTTVRNIEKASKQEHAQTRVIGHLTLGSFNRDGFMPVSMAKLDPVTVELPPGASANRWGQSLQAACLTVNGLTYGSANQSETPTPLTAPPTASTCLSDVVTDSGGEGGFIHFPGPLPTGIEPISNQGLAVQIPGAFIYPFPKSPNASPPIAANRYEANPNLAINTGYRFFDHYDLYYDPILGLQGFRAKDPEPVATPLGPFGVGAALTLSRCLRQRVSRGRRSG